MDNPERITYFGATDSRGKRVPFGIKAKDRERHMYVIGKTGMGKSTLLENMAIQDIRNGEGFAFIDPHGSAVDKLLDYIPADRVKDVVYFAPFDMEHPIAFNVMEDVGYDKRHLVVSGLMATFKKIWVDAWSARMEYILSNTLLALLEYPGATLMGVNRMYTDKAYRKKVVENIKDPLVKDFWVKEFATYTDRYTQEATPAIQNKIGQFTSNPLIRNIIGQPKSSFDIRDLMDRRKILLINLSKGLVGDTNMKLLGSMITTRIFLSAMSRADLSAQDIAKLPKFYFYVDEFQNFANETFAEILSEARKYKLNLLIAHQYVEQMEEEVRAAVFGNVGTTVAFRVGPFDAEVLETIFSPEFMKEDLVNLGFAQVYLTLMIDGVGSRPFSAVTIPPIEAPPRSYRAEVIETSRTQFAARRTAIEEALFAELRLEDNAPAEPEPKKEYAPRRPEGNRDRPPKKPQPQDRPRREQPPPPKAKTSEDLKDILRSMTSQAQQEKHKKESSKQESLKGALKEVVGKSEPPKQTPPQQKQEQGPKPFEVPEDTLRSIFKDNV
ncbi:MAG TPA: type IV secretion system DNA-binding domain-containing protein [Candidatus Paceibacterota bacterium]|nr:type IV secretion system DNA-binding domain-containing protein [Candidatus Paceibacterota bacterium]